MFLIHIYSSQLFHSQIHSCNCVVCTQPYQRAFCSAAQPKSKLQAALSSFGIIESCLTGCGHTLFFDATGGNIIAAWLVVTDLSETCWLVKQFWPFFPPSLAHSPLNLPWELVGDQWYHHHYAESRSRARHPQGKRHSEEEKLDGWTAR